MQCEDLRQACTTTSEVAEGIICWQNQNPSSTPPPPSAVDDVSEDSNRYQVSVAYRERSLKESSKRRSMKRIFSTVLVLLLGVACILPPTVAFAAANNNKGKVGGSSSSNKKRSKKSVSSSSTKRGFGAPPPTLEETLSKFRTRLPPDASTLPCPCGLDPSKKSYGECCEPRHNGQISCDTPLQVLQSRYSAFSYRKIGHIITTTHPKCRDFRDDQVAWAKDLNRAGMFDSFDFVGLQVLRQEENRPESDNEEEEEEEAYIIEFEVRLRGRDDGRSAASLAGEETVVWERSQFLRDPDTGVWLYSGGDVRSQVKGLEDTTLNIS